MVVQASCLQCTMTTDDNNEHNGTKQGPEQVLDIVSTFLLFRNKLFAKLNTINIFRNIAKPLN